MKPAYKMIMIVLMIVLAVFCGVAGSVAVTLTRSPHTLTEAASWLRFVTFMILLGTFLGVIFYGIRHHIFKTGETDKQLLFACTTSLLAAMTAAPLTNGAVNLLTEKEMQRVIVGDHFVRIDGGTADNLAVVLEDTVDPSLRIDRVELANGGGDVNGAIAGGRWLRTHGVNQAVVIGECASACAYMALMFPERDLAAGGSLAFHDIQSMTGDKLAATESRQQLISVLTANGISETVAQSLFGTRALHWLSRSELLAQNLITGCWNPADQTAEPCR